MRRWTWRASTPKGIVRTVYETPIDPEPGETAVHYHGRVLADPYTVVVSTSAEAD